MTSKGWPTIEPSSPTPPDGAARAHLPSRGHADGNRSADLAPAQRRWQYEPVASRPDHPDSHLHTFTAGGVLYAEPSPDWEIPVKDERRVRLDRIASEEGEAFVYEYDLGDSWRHKVLVEEVRVRSGSADGSSKETEEVVLRHGTQNRTPCCRSRLQRAGIALNGGRVIDEAKGDNA
jgi:hypothetical protein